MSRKIHHISDIDIKFNTIIECANRILEFEKELATAEKDTEKEYLNFSIEEQKKLIEEYTDTSTDYILPRVAVLNAMKKQIEIEKDSEKNKLRKEKLADLTNNLKSEVCRTSSKESKFRNSKKVDIVPSITLKEGSHVPKELANEQR